MRKYGIAFFFLILPAIVLAEDLTLSCDCPEGPCSGFFNIRHREPGGIGYRRGYSSADFFYSLNFNSCFYGFLDLRGHIFNDGKWATNLGVGLRYLPDCYDGVFGANLYWDFREAQHSHFYQIGGGLEWLCPCWDFRINGYGIVGPSKHKYLTKFDNFSGNQANFFRKSELGLSGGDFLLGRWLYRGCIFDLHAGLGGYAFFGDFGKNAFGGLVRLKTKFWDWIYAEGQVSYDNRFKWQGQGELGIHFSFGPHVERYERRVCSCCDLIAIEERLVEQPERFEIIVTTTHREKATAQNPVTGEPLRFLFVDSLSGSNGTFESPFKTLEDAIAASGPEDAIYLFPGTGGTYGTDPTTTLKDYQLIGGSGAPFEVATRFGVLNIPPQTSARPKIGTTFILANRNYLTGLQVFNPGFNTMQLVLKEAPVIRDNLLVGTKGITIENSTNIPIIERNVILTQGGPSMSFGETNGNAYIRCNILSASDLDAFEDAAIFGTLFTGDLVIENNIITSTSKGIHFEDDFNGEVQMKGNKIDAAEDDVIIGGIP